MIKGLQVGWKYAVMVIAIVVLTLLVIDFNNRMGNSQRLKLEKNTVAVKATQIIETNQALTTAIAYATSDPAVWDWAYNSGKMVREGENPVIPLPQETTGKIPIPEITPQPTSEPNWNKWLTLFTKDCNR